MSESLDRVVSAAVLRILRPLVRILLRHGFAYGSFAELARKAYVEEGYAQVAASGKRQTVSSVSAITGLTRKETVRLRDLDIGEDLVSHKRYNRAVRVISGWMGDSRFQTGAGAPATLPLDDSDGSFNILVRDYSGDIPPAAMLSVLESSGAISVDDGKVTLEARAYLPLATSEEKLDILGVDVGELITTIDHNLQVGDPRARFFQRKVSNVRLHPDEVENFRKFSNRKSQHLLEEFDEWLTERELAPGQTIEVEPHYVAVGICYTQRTPEEEDEL